MFDAAIIGLGAVGAATLMHLARAGSRVVGIDQFSPPHNRGSSHGETRITRIAVGEGPEFVPLVRRSHELWRSIESEAETQILTITGGLVLGGGPAPSMHGVDGFPKRTVELAKQFGVPHEVLSGKEARARFPEFNVPDGDLVYFEPGAGFVRPEAAIEAQLKLAERSGAAVRRNERVTAVKSSGGGVKIQTAGGDIEAGRCLVAAGAWIKDFVPETMKPQFTISRQVLHWAPIEAGKYSLRSSPIFIWCYGAGDEDVIYGFPSLDGKTIKLASESLVPADSPEEINRAVTVEEQRMFFEEKIGSRLKAITGPPKKSVACLYTVTPKSKFIISPHPEMPEVLLASCCSGHGFKHSAALGESIAAVLTGKTPAVDLSSFDPSAVARG